MSPDPASMSGRIQEINEAVRRIEQCRRLNNFTTRTEERCSGVPTKAIDLVLGELSTLRARVAELEQRERSRDVQPLDVFVGPRFEMCGECGGHNGDGYEDITHEPTCSKSRSPVPASAPAPESDFVTYDGEHYVRAGDGPAKRPILHECDACDTPMYCESSGTCRGWLCAGSDR